MKKTDRFDTNLLTRKSDRGLDHYRTPDYATEALLKREIFTEIILDPGCGDGAISKILKQHLYHVKSFDIEAKKFGYGFTKDFFTYKNECENIIMNPPYNLATEFILHGLKLIKEKMAVIVRLSFLETSKRYETLFKVYPPNKIYLFSKRVDMRRSSNKVFGGGTTYAWLVWDKTKLNNSEIIFKFIND